MTNQIQQQNNQLEERNVTDVILNRVNVMKEEGTLQIPPNYSVENALKSAWLVLQDIKTSKKYGMLPVLQACSKHSVVNALLDMVTQGLNPAKKQCYFIPYGYDLQLMRSYFGDMAVAKRLGAKSVSAMVIYEGDEVELEIENARVVRVHHKQSFASITNDGNKIIGAYATLVHPDGSYQSEVMSMDMLLQSWKQGDVQKWHKGDGVSSGSTHAKFTGEMAKRTVIRKVCKAFVNSSDDSNIYQTADVEYEEVDAIDAEIEEKSNRIPLDVEAPQEIEAPQENEVTQEEIEAPKEAELVPIPNEVQPDVEQLSVFGVSEEAPF